MRRLRATLPRGLHDTRGIQALHRNEILRSFQHWGVESGARGYVLSPVGFASTFLEFGHAAEGRIFDFPDRSGRSLALAADSVPSLARAVASDPFWTPGTPMRVTAEAPVFRYTREPNRHWTQLVLSAINQTVTEDSILQEALSWSRFFRELGIACTFEVTNHTQLDEIADRFSVDREELRSAVRGRENLNKTLVPAIEEAHGVAARYRNNEEVAYVASSAAKRFVGALNSQGVDAILVDRWVDGSEYMAGLSWKVRGASGKTLGEGGDYSSSVSDLYSDIRTFWSACASLERLVEARADLEPAPVLLDVHPATSVALRDQVIASLRAQGFVVISERGGTRRNLDERAQRGWGESLRATLSSDSGDWLIASHSSRGGADRRLPIG